MLPAILLPAILAFVASSVGAAFPPTGAVWHRLATNPILAATAPWEGAGGSHPCVCEPQATVVQDPLGNSWRLYYRGGWGGPNGIGLATSSDGVQWTKHPGNPVYGGLTNGSGVVGSFSQPWVYQAGPTDWWLFSSGGGTLDVARSADGIGWLQAKNVSFPMPAGQSITGNRAAWREANGTWTMFQEVGNAPVWEIYVYTSHDGLQWSVLNEGKPLSALQRAQGGMYGGPSLAVVEGQLRPRDDAGLIHLWYHAAEDRGDLPTNIYHASAPSPLGPWTVSPSGPVLSHLGNSSGVEDDQVADPSAIVQNGKAFLFYDADNNAKGEAFIGGATTSDDKPKMCWANTLHGWILYSSGPCGTNTDCVDLCDCDAQCSASKPAAVTTEPLTED